MSGLRQNLSAVIDVECKCKLQTGARGYYAVQVDHRTALLPQKSVQGIAAIRRMSDDLSLGIDRLAAAARIATNRSKIENLTVLPTNCMVNAAFGKIR